MKNKYTPISDSDDSSKTLNDEKADSQSSPSDGTPPPYSVSKKNVDLEMAPETEESSKKKRYLTPRELAIVFAIFIVYNVCLIIARVILLVYEIPFNQLAVWVLFGVWCALFLSLTIVITQMPKEWFTQAGRATKKILKKFGRATKNVLSTMCIAALYVCFLDVPGFTLYYAAKKFSGFEKINNNFFYAVCFVNFVLFLYLTMNANARERLRLVVFDMGNGIGSGINGLGNGIGNAVDHMFGTNRGEQVSQNEGIELQPLAAQSAEV
ncbi:wtf meiotic driver [Schizosaccharomyces osmophilus]|uniref:Wtf meiotic driver n=1 Tax=Schizosaccharomyces osmophilus TaxID=2545709 RepID=A0AAE9WBV2_9SCHI|nr:wtf meiotic driver [Schizosaccharomyces osmophilus]WBW71798.1 wtf meiotic driver [Schizosaccharomyces osmophilus]